MAECHASHRIELLAPAKNAEIAIEAIKHGADAVYMGASSHGARYAAANSVEDIARAVDFAHKFGARIYVTVNTIIYDDELCHVERLVDSLYRIGTDALIVQDMALLNLDIPPIELHASTQCDIRTPEKARFLARAGFSQLVLARELGLEEIREIASVVTVPLEAFVHGALCVSYSGDCQAGYVTSGRSANRGECPQICRHSFDLIDSHGRVMVKGKHLLSLRDLNRYNQLESLIDAGVSSFKIEGRLKDVAYVKNVVAAYSRRLDEIIASSGGRYCRTSHGVEDYAFIPDLNKCFNRGYTDYFTTSRYPSGKMASIDSPKWTGEVVGTALAVSSRRIKARLSATLANGDGLGYFDSSGTFQGFRLNRVSGSMLFPAQSVSLRPGTVIYRNHDRVRTELMSGDTSKRYISVRLTLRVIPWGVALDIADEYGVQATAAMPCDHTPAKGPQIELRREVMSRIGDTVYRVISFDDNVGSIFIPKSMLAVLRRRAIEVYSRAISATHAYGYHPRHISVTEEPVSPAKLTYHDNVANAVAAAFYREHGATEIQTALEVNKTSLSGVRVMQTRYCLRRESGRCLKTSSGREWSAGPMYLTSGNIKFRVEFDCSNCQMNIYSI